MKKNNTINVLLLVLCFLLLGFVYVNTQLMDHFKNSDQVEYVAPDQLNDDEEDTLREK